MPKTITSVGIEKIGRRFADSIDHAADTPVSYTHLDVYKRQVKKFENAPMRGGSGKKEVKK